ncbi:MAG TPA: hypothetical protein PLK12_03865 [Prolixibacteraceae bacterium]|nr:hypothetical protein [Prolixibacteraceae bacterium]
MKAKSVILVLLMSFVLVFCKNDDNDSFFPLELATVKNSVIASFDSLNHSISVAVDQFSQAGIDTTEIRKELVELYTSSSFATEFVFTTPEGIMQIIEPPAYYASQGADISQQSHVISAFQTREPVLSNSFMVVEGYLACVDVHPMVNNGQILGTISAVLDPGVMLERILAPIVKDQSFEIWVMEKSGRVIFDQDAEEIGLNVLTDPLYADFPELITACRKIANEETGETSYSFYQAGSSRVVKKKTYWNTFHLYTNEWKIIWVKPE